MKREENPCYKCTDRKALCHVGCKRAKEFEEKRKAEKLKIYKAMAADNTMRDYQHKKRLKYYNYKSGKYYGK